MILEVKISFKIDKNNEAEIGDTITIKDRDKDHYFITRLNDKNIFSIWMRKNWINAHCTNLL